MPTDLLRWADGRPRIDLDCLYPAFLELVLHTLADCRNAGSDYFVVSGFRSWSEQAKLYFQGRTTPGLIVTNAQPGYSAHNFGLAVDVSLDKDKTRAGLQPDADPGHYELIGHYAQARGLVWGGSWKHPDRPHLQWPGYVTLQELQPLRDVWQQQVGAGVLTRLATVWAGIGPVLVPPEQGAQD